MIGKIFSILAIFSFTTAIFTGNIVELCNSIIEGAQRSVSVALSIMGMMILWSGIMSVLKEGGIINKLSKLLRPVLKRIFPKSFKDNVATDEITACVSANLLGISNAATPLGIRAIEEMNKSNSTDKATNDMITLCIIGCACFNLVPTTILALRNAYGAVINQEIIIPVWICSGICMIFGVLLSKMFGVKNE